MKDWRRSFFRREIFTPGQPEALAVAPNEAAFVWRALGLRRGMRVLDVCCGTGRHARCFARRGASVVGVDATAAYLEEARRQPDKRLHFELGDMRRLPYDSEFDAAINLWTSFGYFEKPSDDLKTLKSIRRALKPGGLFLIDVMNADWLRRNFQPKRWQRRGDGSYLLEDSTLTKDRDPRVLSEWTVLRRDAAPARAKLVVRQYDWERLSAALRKAGLHPMRRWGGLAGERFGPESIRLVVLSRRDR